MQGLAAGSRPSWEHTEMAGLEGCGWDREGSCYSLGHNVCPFLPKGASWKMLRGQSSGLSPGDCLLPPAAIKMARSFGITVGNVP